MAREGFFRTVTRYAGRENRLTGALAVVLRRNATLAHRLALAWTRPDPSAAASGEVAVRDTAQVYDALLSLDPVIVQVDVQWPIPAGQVDLQLRFRSRAPIREVVIWVEVKHEADPHEDQLPKYVRTVPNDGAVVLLAPRSSLPYEDPELVPPEVPQRSWQAAGEIMRETMRESSAPDPIANFLLEELYIHMQEQHLTDPDALRPEHLTALEYWDEADGAFREVCRLVSEYLERKWRRSTLRNEAGRGPVPRYGLGYWEAWALDAKPDPDGGPAALGKRWLDWNASRNPTVPQSHGRSLLFISGLTADDIVSLAPSDEDWERARRLETGVQIDGRVARFERVTDTHERITQLAQPDQVLVGATLREQAESLGAWIITGFNALTMPLEQLTPSTES